MHYGITLRTPEHNELEYMHITMHGLQGYMEMNAMRGRMGRGRAGAARRGAVQGFAYGYNVDLKVSGGDIVRGGRTIDEEKADTVKWIFKQYADGMSLTQIVSNLNELGIPSPRKKLWQRAVLCTRLRSFCHEKRIYDYWRVGILANEIYIGRYIYDKMSYRKVEAGGEKREAYLRPKSEWKRLEVPHLRIIDDATWNAVQERIALLDKQYPSTSPFEEAVPNMDNKIDFIMLCPVCNGRLVGDGGERLACSTYKLHRTCTFTSKVNVTKLYKFIGEQIFNDIEKIKQSRVLVQTDEQSLQEEIATLQQRKKRLTDLLADENVVGSVVSQQIKDTEEQIETLERFKLKTVLWHEDAHPLAFIINRKVRKNPLSKRLINQLVHEVEIDQVRDGIIKLKKIHLRLDTVEKAGQEIELERPERNFDKIQS